MLPATLGRLATLSLFCIRDLAVKEGDLQVFVCVNLFASEVGEFLRLAKGRNDLIDGLT